MKLPKLGVMLIVLTVGSPVLAAPILNMNAPGATEITVYPDHMDRDLYYIAPTVMLVARDENNVPLFSYIEEAHTFSVKAVVQTTMVPVYNQPVIETTKKTILAFNPKAQFAALPYVNSSVIFGELLNNFIELSQCDHPAGVVGQEETCSFRLNSTGRRVFRDSFKQGLTITLQLQYTVEGVMANADGSYSNKTNLYGMAGRLGGKDLGRYPELFRDSRGRVIGINNGDNDGDDDRRNRRN